MLDIMFVDESSAVQEKSLAKKTLIAKVKPRNGVKTLDLRTAQSFWNGACTPSSSGASSSASIGRILLPSIEDQAVSFFFSNFAEVDEQNVGFNLITRTYDKDHAHGPIRAVVRAVGLACLSNVAENQRIKDAALANYVSAVSITNNLLRDSATATEDLTLFTIMMLSMFEVSLSSLDVISIIVFLRMNRCAFY